ncbi:hypothetical protein [Tunicatimonas pelagia]|uniref:hypothetical protein n=1 Tax=Tunicatimonas pelagia TaxID=931531 RepID=UPI002665A002|nr:hypothetical protein [Tunicatimonas pelagia]WKN45448.1 hypothetical protein P0M28_10810 [Tunicatimonas pelagia]
MGFHLGGRDQEGAFGLWLSVPKKLRKKALCFTDDGEAYVPVFAKGQPGAGAHQREGKWQTRIIERPLGGPINNTVRQRCAR